MSLRIYQSHLDAIFAQAITESPNECCGILVGDGVAIREVHPVANVWEGEKTRRFMIDAKVHLRLQRESREHGLSVVGFYHSHPHGPPNPSRFDAELAWQEHSYLIVSLEGNQRGDARSWRWEEQSEQFLREDIEIISETRSPSGRG